MILSGLHTIGRRTLAIISLLGIVLFCPQARATPIKITIPSIQKVEQISKPSGSAQGVFSRARIESAPADNTSTTSEDATGQDANAATQPLVGTTPGSGQIAQAGLIRAFVILANASQFIVMDASPTGQAQSQTQIAHATPEQQWAHLASGASDMGVSGVIVRPAQQGANEQANSGAQQIAPQAQASLENYASAVMPVLARPAAQAQMADANDLGELAPAAGADAAPPAKAPAADEPLIALPTEEEPAAAKASAPTAVVPSPTTAPAPRPMPTPQIAPVPPASPQTNAPAPAGAPTPAQQQNAQPHPAQAQQMQHPQNNAQPNGQQQTQQNNQNKPQNQQNNQNKQQPNGQQQNQQNNQNNQNKPQQNNQPQNQQNNQNKQQPNSQQQNQQNNQNKPQQNNQPQNQQNNQAQSKPCPTAPQTCTAPAPQKKSAAKKKPKKSAAKKSKQKKPVPQGDSRIQPLHTLPRLPDVETQAVGAQPGTFGEGVQTQQNLSPKSRRILNDLPSGIDQKKDEKIEHLQVQHALPSGDIGAGANSSEVTAKREAMGINIEVSKPALDVTYELRKAYDAQVRGDSTSAIEVYNEVLAAEPDNTQALLGLATSYHRSGQPNKARPLYGRVLSIDHNNKVALNNFMILLSDEAPQEALTQLQGLEERNPDFAAVPAQMAVIYQKIGQPQKAIENMVKAVRLSTNNMNYRYNLAVLLDRQRNYTQAAILYAQILEANGRGEAIPGDPQKIQERLTFIRSNRP